MKSGEKQFAINSRFEFADFDKDWNNAMENNNNNNNNRELIDILNDLIRINRDRAEGYRKAIDELKLDDPDLKAMFSNIADTSLKNSNILATEVRNFSEEPVVSRPGRVYRMWMDIRSTMTAQDRKSTLSACVFGEGAAIQVYGIALESGAVLPADIRRLISDQRAALLNSQHTVKRYRDAYERIGRG